MNKKYFNVKIKHFHYLIGKYCKDNNIKVFSGTWDRISEWEDDFNSTKDQEYPILILDDELTLCGSFGLKTPDENDLSIDNLDEIFLYLDKRKKNFIPFFKNWKVELKNDKFIFGCGEVKLTKDEIKSFDKIYRILIDKEVIEYNNDILNFLDNIKNKTNE